MKKQLLKENQEDFKFQTSPELTNKRGGKYKKLYVFGKTTELNDTLKALGKTMKKEFGVLWDPDVRARWFHIKPNSAGEFEENIQTAIETKVTPFITRINEFYQYTLDINELIAGLEEYVPSESDNPNEIAATPEEADFIKRRLEDFKEKMLNISSSEELQEIMQLMGDVKSGKDGTGISPLNKISVKAQRPTATYVNNRKNWETWYKRKIKDGAKPIFITAPADKTWNKDAQQGFLADKGKKWGELSGREKEDHYEVQRKSNKGRGYQRFILTAVYDISDTEQMEGTHDELGVNKEKANAAAAKLGDRNIDGTETSTDATIIKPVYDGLLAYTQAQPDITVTAPREITATSTKLLANAIFTQILSGQISGFAFKASTEASSRTARRQQAEIAAWQLMEAFKIPIALGDVDMGTVFGHPEPNKTPEQQRKQQKNQISNVLTDIQKAVNQLIDFIKNQKDGISEIENEMPQATHVTVMSIAKDLGIPNDMIQETGLEQLAERLRIRFNIR